jgi:hypothetical protein
MRRLATLAAASLLATLTVTGCASGDEQPETATDRGLEVEDLSPSPVPEGFDAGSEAAPTRCSDLSPAPDGRYPVGEAGVVTITAEDGALVLEDVEPAEGWEHEVAQEDDLKVDVRFTAPDDDAASVALVALVGTDGPDAQAGVRVQYCDEVP